jgi:hypothetical protein
LEDDAVAEIPTQPVEFLAVSQVTCGDPTGEPAVVLTIRLDPMVSFEPVNLALSEAQAGRLLADLMNLLIPFALLIGVLLVATVGCSGRVEVESAKWASSSGEKARTTVEANLLQSRPPETVAKADPAAKMLESPPPPKPVPSEVKPINISGNTFVLNIRGGDTHVQTIVQIQEPPPRVQERIVIRREVETKPRHPVDDRCDRGQREHEARIKKWREFPRGY